MLRWLVSSDVHKISFWKKTKSITEPHNLTCQAISCIIQPWCENLEATYFVCLLAFTPGHLVFSVTSGCLKFSGQKTHRFLASASQRFLLCLTAPACISQFTHLICVIQGIFSLWFILVLFYFLSEGRIHHDLPLSSNGVRLCFTSIPGLQSQ